MALPPLVGTLVFVIIKGGSVLAFVVLTIVVGILVAPTPVVRTIVVVTVVGGLVFTIVAVTIVV